MGTELWSHPPSCVNLDITDWEQVVGAGVGAVGALVGAVGALVGAVGALVGAVGALVGAVGALVGAVGALVGALNGALDGASVKLARTKSMVYEILIYSSLK